MPINSSRGVSRKQIEEDRQQHEKHKQLQAQGAQQQQKQLQDLLQNPQVIELLTRPDMQDSEPWLADIAGEHLHIDQVISIFNRDDLWRKGWGNKITATKLQMSYPFPESRSSDQVVNRIQQRIHGHDKQPMTADQRRKVEAVFEQKTDREKRSDSGEFVNLLLSQVVTSEERSSDSSSASGGLSSILPGGE